MGMILATFHCLGKYPLLMQLLKRHVSKLIVDSGNLLIIKFEISSGPLDFFELMLKIMFFIFSDEVKWYVSELWRELNFHRMSIYELVLS